MRSSAADGREIACCLPVRNPGPEFLETLRSFETCASKPFLIVVDDGSAVPVAVDFAGLAINGTVIRFEGKVGLPTALNAALSLAYGLGYEVIARMDGDDLNHPHRFSAQVAYLHEHPECLVVFGCADLIDENGRPVGIGSAPRDGAKLNRVMALNNVLIHPTAAMRRDYISRYGLYSDRYPHAEDYEYFMRGLTDGVVQVMNSRLISYRIRSGSVSFVHYRKQLLSRLRIQTRYLRFFGVWGWIGIARTLFLLVAGIIWPGGSFATLRRRRLLASSPAPSASDPLRATGAPPQ